MRDERCSTRGAAVTAKAPLLLLALSWLAAATPAAEPPGYYNGTAGLTGTALHAALHNIIDDHTRFDYTGSGTDVWDILAAADEDPGNSANVIDVYKNRSIPKTDHSQETGWAREHSWAKSYGFENLVVCNYPYTDCHHLFATDWGYNSSRNNRVYDSCDVGCTEYPTTGNPPGGNYSNYGKGDGNTGAWETWIDRRGDLARAQLYMDVRYQGGTHGFSGCDEPDLILTNDRELMISSTQINFSPAYFGVLDTLLQWNLDDPVDDFERRRNDVVFGYQQNRNPFIDHPEWVCAIWGGDCAETTSTAVFINELHYDNNGTDIDEGVEIAGPVGTVLTGWSLVAYNGGDGQTYSSKALSGTLADQDSGYGTAWFAWSGLQNGPADGLALVDDEGVVVQFLSYEGAFVANGGPAAGMTATDTGVAEAATSAVGHSLQLTGTGTFSADFSWAGSAPRTPGQPNGGQNFQNGPTPWINELHYDNAGTDVGEGIEIAGRAGINLSGWSLVAYDGGAGTSYATLPLAGLLGDQENGYGTLWTALAAMQNGPDAVALVDDEGTVVQLLSYEGSFTASGGPAGGKQTSNIGVSESGSTPVGSSLQLAGAGTAYDNFAWSVPANDTPGQVNVAQSFGSAPTASPWINELHYDNNGTDVDEGVEIVGEAGLNLGGWSVVAYNGADGKVYGSTPLSGVVPDQQNGYGTKWFAIPGLQNGHDALALVSPQGVVAEFLSYEGSFTAVDGPAATLLAADIVVVEAAASPVGQSLQRSGAGNQAAEFTWSASAAHTRGLVNNGQTCSPE